MEETSNYQLNQWESTDRILMEDFNADNAKIDAALAAAGNCRIVIGSYVGTGTSGKNNPNTLTFDFEPMVIFMDVTTRVGGSAITNSGPGYSIFFRGVEECNNANGKGLVTTWDGNSVSWYYDSSASDSVKQQYNTNNQIYYYIAMG